MNFLIMDASSPNVSFCISSNGQILFSSDKRYPGGASKLIKDMDSAFRKIPISIKDFDALVLGRGPGSFTGLRISFSIVKAFVMTRRLPVILINSFFSCAYPFRKKYNRIKVVADARRGRVYMSSFAAKDGNIRQKQKPALFSLEDALRKRNGNLYVTYDSGLRDDMLSRCEKINFFPRNVYPKAKYLLEDALRSYKKREFISLSGMEPMYLHPRTCQIRSGKK